MPPRSRCRISVHTKVPPWGLHCLNCVDIKGSSSSTWALHACVHVQHLTATSVHVHVLPHGGLPSIWNSNKLHMCIFSISVTFWSCNIAAAVLSCLWTVFFLFLNAFQCHLQVVRTLWTDVGNESKCMASGRIWLGLELTNLFLDTMIFVMPLFVIRQLSLETSRKYSLAETFWVDCKYYRQ